MPYHAILYRGKEMRLWGKYGIRPGHRGSTLGPIGLSLLHVSDQFTRPEIKGLKRKLNFKFLKNGKTERFQMAHRKPKKIQIGDGT